MSSIKENEWLSELEKLSASNKNDEGLTTKEWAVKLGLSEKVASERLQAAHNRGRLKLGHRSIVRRDGRPNQVPVYSIIPAKKGK